jgi:hypothetical protein
MNACSQHSDVTICCAFCGNPLPNVNGQVQPWRAASGLFFCNEFCADDSEEARFQRREERLIRTADTRAHKSGLV